MRFYIYLFGGEGYHTMIEMGKQLEKDDPYDKLKYVISIMKDCELQALGV